MDVRSCALSIWHMLDPVYFNLTRLTYLEKDTITNPCILRVRLTKYKGRTIQLTDGTILKRNDLLIKIHLHNVQLLSEMKDIRNDYRRARYIYKKVWEALPKLATYVASHPNAEDIKGVIGITMLNKGASRLGFEIHPIKNKYYRFFKKCTVLPIHLLSNNSFQSAIQHSPPEYLLISKHVLLNRYYKKSIVNQ